MTEERHFAAVKCVDVKEYSEVGKLGDVTAD